jgi:fructose-1,6-bisphosphatase II
MVSVGSVSADSVSLDEDRVLVFELVRATEAAAVAAARFLGRGDRGEVDAAAVDAMRPVLGTIPMRGVVVIGKGEKEHDPMLHGGEQVGSGVGPAVDIAIDPVDGAGLTAKSLPNAMSVIAVADQGAMFDPGRCVYMDKLVVGADLADLVDFDAPIEDTLAAIARARGSSVAEVTVALVERPRHEELVRRLRAVGARIRFLVAGDVAGALMALLPESEVDVLVGVGGSPEGIVAACAAACMGGAIFGQLRPRNEQERREAEALGQDVSRVLTTTDLVRGPNTYFVATGVTDGDVLRGVRYSADLAVSQSLAMRSRTGVVRLIEARHRLSTSPIVMPRV